MITLFSDSILPESCALTFRSGNDVTGGSVHVVIMNKYIKRASLCASKLGGS